MHATAVQDFRETRPRLLRVDPLLLLATLGLIVASVYTVHTATHGDIPGDPNYYMNRQIVYIARRAGADARCSPASTTRACASGSSASTGFMIGAILLVYVLGFVGARLAAGDRVRLLQLPGVRDGQAAAGGRAGRLHGRPRPPADDRETTSRIVLLALVPAMLVVAQPDLGSGLVYLAIVLAVLFVAGTQWTHFAALGGLAAAAIVVVLWPLRRPGWRCSSRTRSTV